jgi:hypothetical protein
MQLGGQSQVGASEGSSSAVGGIAAVRVQISPASWTGLRLVASAGYVREAWEGPIYDDDSGKWLPGSPNGANGAWGQIAAAGDAGRFRWSTSAHLEHVFSTGRDPLDLMMQAGVSYAVAGPLRAGAEWVGQDLEESFGPGAEGGARHFIGPIASIQALDQRLSVVAGPAIGLSSSSPHLVARAALSYGF